MKNVLARKKVLVIGAGNIGSLIALLLLNSNRYQVYLADQHPHALAQPYAHSALKAIQLDVDEAEKIIDFIKQHEIEAVVASLPYFVNIRVAKIASQAKIHYFDLTEDQEVAKQITEMAKNSEQVFMPCCGVAPGLVNIVAHDLIQRFEKVDSAKLRVGCLPQSASNDLKYALTWSTDGLINEYGNLCHGLVHGEISPLQPLQGLENLEIDGVHYEAFNTSGGIGSLLNTYERKVQTLNYKTIRYPGHRDKIRFLMEDLKLNEHRSILKSILEQALPKTRQDFMIMYVAVAGYRNNEFYEESYMKKLLPTKINQVLWSSIQFGTASSLCAVLDIVLSNRNQYHGLVRQEQIKFQDFLANHFGSIFK